MSDLNEAAKAARKMLEASFTGRMCPILSVAGLKPKTGSGLLDSMGDSAGLNSGEAIGCQGPNCMFFMLTAADEHGHPKDGACSVALLPAAVMQLRANFDHFTQHYKIRSKD